MGKKADASIQEGSCISISCVHVDEYQGKKSLNSAGSTVVEVNTCVIVLLSCNLI